MENKNLFFILAVKDELTNTFLQPTFIDDLEAGKRLFKTQINTLPIWKDNPTDFSLYQIGYFDQETGSITPKLEKIISGLAVKENERR